MEPPAPSMFAIPHISAAPAPCCPGGATRSRRFRVSPILSHRCNVTCVRVCVSGRWRNIQGDDKAHTIHSASAAHRFKPIKTSIHSAYASLLSSSSQGRCQVGRMKPSPLPRLTSPRERRSQAVPDALNRRPRNRRRAKNAARQVRARNLTGIVNATSPVSIASRYPCGGIIGDGSNGIGCGSWR